MPTQPIPMFGAWNEHWKNHPAGLPKSQYKPNTNPNTGASAVDAAWNAARQAAAAQNPAPQQPAPQQPAPQQPAPQQPAPQTPAAPTGSATTPLQGFASQYTPAMLNQLYENPWYVLPDVFNGINLSSPLYQQLRDIGADPLALYNIARGAQGINTGGAEDFANWLASTYQTLGTAGGQNFNARNLLNTLFSAGGTDTSLGQILGAGDMGTQIRTLYNLARDVSNVGLNPLAARGYQSALAQLGDAYGNSQLGAPAGQSMSPAEWMRQNASWLTL